MNTVQILYVFTIYPAICEERYSNIYTMQDNNRPQVSVESYFTFHWTAEDVSPASVVYGASTCPGETDEPGHSFRPGPETADHLLHLYIRDSKQLLNKGC